MIEDQHHQRKFPRVPSENVVLLHKLEPGADEELAKTGTVGLGGCMIVSKVPVGVGSLLSVMISVSGQVVKTEARVVYELEKGAREYHVGVEFLRLLPSDRDLLANLLGSLV